MIHWLGNGLSDGSQGPDLSPIPAIALKQVEVLRDGASAQYGSDAIAGVLNPRRIHRCKLRGAWQDKVSKASSLLFSTARSTYNSPDAGTPRANRRRRV